MRFLASFFLLALAFVEVANASHNHQLNRILEAKEAPDGIVFEVLSRRPNYLEWAIPEIKLMIAKLHTKYPKTPVAVVSHSREQFALTVKNQVKQQKIHHQVKSLVNDADIPVHVCGILAERGGLSAGDFPDYVDVAESGPIQIGIYREMGYKVIMITGH